MEKLHSQLPQPLKRSSPSRHGDLLTQIRNSNSPASNRSPARRTVTSSPNSIRSRDAATKQPEVKARSPPEVLSRSRDGTATPTRRPKYCTAATGNMSPVAKGKISRQQRQQAVMEVEVSDAKQSPLKSLAARQPAKTSPAQPRTLRSHVGPYEPYGEVHYDKVECDETESPWTPNSQPSTSGTVAGIKKSVSPKWERRSDCRKAEQLEKAAEEDDKNNGGGSPIYHELDPPGTSRFAVQHTYQSIVEISDELESLKLASTKPEPEELNSPSGRHLSRAKSAQELTQKSPTKLSLFSRFRFGAKKSSASSAKSSGKGERRVCPPEVNGQRSLQDVDLISRSRDEVGVASTHDRQPSFSTFAHRAALAGGGTGNDDGYSCVYVPPRSPDRSSVVAGGVSARVPPRTSSLVPAESGKPAPEPLYRQKFLKIASVHTLRGSSADDARVPGLTSSNSVGDLLLASTDVGHQSPRRVTSYDDHAVATGSRKAAAASGRKETDFRSQIARFGLSPGRGASFSSPSCGIRMAEMRVAVRRCTNDVSTSPARSPSASTPVPSPSRAPVFQFSVPPVGVMMSPPVQRAFRHVSSQTVMSVRPPSASCVLSIAHIHGPAAQMQTIEEEDDDSANDDLQSASPDREPHREGRTQRNGSQRTPTTILDDAGEAAEKVAGQKRAENGCRTADDGSDRRNSPEVASVGSKTSRLRRPSPSVVAKPLSGSPLPEHHSSRIVPPSAIVALQKRAESSSVSPPSTPRSLDSQARSAPARAELVRRPAARGQQQQRKQVAPPADSDATTTAVAIVDGLLVPGGRKSCARRPTAPNDCSSPNLSSDSSLSLLSTGSDADALAGSPAPESAIDAATSPCRTSDTRPVHHRHSPSSRVARLSELTVPARMDHSNY